MVDPDVRRMDWLLDGSHLCLGIVICLALWMNNASIYLCTYDTLLNRLILYLKGLLPEVARKEVVIPSSYEWFVYILTTISVNRFK
jgi:hypothetical protein